MKKNQHYVPQVYLKAWETTVSSLKEPRKKFRGVNCFSKQSLEKGDGRNKDSVLTDKHTYTIDFNHCFILPFIPEAEQEFGDKIKGILSTHKSIAKYNGKRLTDTNEFMDILHLLDEWEFYKADNLERLAPKRAIINNIKEIRSYLLEDALDKFVETKWLNLLERFTNEIAWPRPIDENGIDIEVNEETISEIIKIMLLFMCRNPNFDCLGVFTDIGQALLQIMIDNKSDEDDYNDFLEYTERQIHGAWLTEIYKGLFNDDRGFCKLYLEKIAERCQVTVLRCDNANGSFITSDNPAFAFYSNVYKSNRNAFYFPISPNYLLLIGKGGPHLLNMVNVRQLSNRGVKIYNRIILSQTYNTIVSTQKYLGYII